MNETTSLEAIKLISNWGKWLVTIETGAIAIIGSLFMSEQRRISDSAKRCGTLAIASFLISIVAAAMLLLTLPEMAQNVRPDQNIWLTEDSVAGRILHMNTQAFAVAESVFFGIGIISLVAMIVLIIWSRSDTTVT